MSGKPAPTIAVRSRKLGRRALSATIGLALLTGIGSGWPWFGPVQAQGSDKIVVAGGVITEVLYALGLQDRIVGVDSTSQFPPTVSASLT